MFDFGFHFFGNSRSSTPPTPPPSDDFIIKVKTDNAGTSNDDQFRLPTTSGFTYDYTIDWGDGVVENITTTTQQTHTYPTAGEYVITISGTFPRIAFANGGDRGKLIEIINFGNVGFETFASAFWGCNNMDINPDSTGVFDKTDISFSSAFRDCSSLTNVSALDLSNGSTFNRAWWNCVSMDSFNVTALGGEVFSESWRNCGVINSFATRNFYNMTDGTNAFNGTTLPTEDYSDILITQRANNNNNDVTFHGGNSKYNVAGGIARDELTDTVANGGQNWSITDGGAE